MDAVSAKKLGILESLISISSDGSDISALVHSNVNFIIGNSYDENEAVRSAAIELVAKLAEAPKCRQILLANGILGVLDDVASTADAATASRIAGVQKALKSDSGSASASSSGPANLETRSITIHMTKLLANREAEDEYIKALLVVEGVTSVTIDRKREVAVIFTTDGGLEKGSLYDVVQRVCNTIHDNAGRRRVKVDRTGKGKAAAGGAVYLTTKVTEADLDDDDGGREGTTAGSKASSSAAASSASRAAGAASSAAASAGGSSSSSGGDDDDEEEEEDFFAAGSKSAVGQRFRQGLTYKSAEERLAEEKARQKKGLFSWIGW